VREPDSTRLEGSESKSSRTSPLERANYLLLVSGTDNIVKINKYNRLNNNINKSMYSRIG
jgi:hypothetical protein